MARNPTPQPDPAIAGRRFRASLDALEQLVEKMEHGEMSLEESLAAYERGVGLYRRCQTALEQAELRVRLLSDPQEPASAEPFRRPQPAMPDPFARRMPWRRASTGWRQRVDAALAHALPAHILADTRLHAAMRHAVLLGGKRMRPLLVYATGTAFGADDHVLDAPAAAVELIHAYSLVHDDLPAMDDDALRRGQPTVHVAFDEATAILAGDALQSLAFELLAGTTTDDASDASRCCANWPCASGAAGMCGGQALDLAATGSGSALRLDELERLHALKTGALIRARRCAWARLRPAADDDHARASTATPTRSASPSRSATTSSTSKATAPRSARPRARTRRRTRRPFPALIGMDASRARLLELRGVMRRSPRAVRRTRQRTGRARPHGDRTRSLTSGSAGVRCRLLCSLSRARLTPLPVRPERRPSGRSRRTGGPATPPSSAFDFATASLRSGRTVECA